jgi:hypothetical protein
MSDSRNKGGSVRFAGNPQGRGQSLLIRGRPMRRKTAGTRFRSRMVQGLTKPAMWGSSMNRLQLYLIVTTGMCSREVSRDMWTGVIM